MDSDALKGALKRDEEALAQSLKRGVDPAAGLEALKAATMNGFSEGVDMIIKSLPELAHSERNPLIAGARCGASEKIIDIFVGNGCDINVRDENEQNKTPLMVAACGGHVETVEALLKYPECDRNAIGGPPVKINRIDEFHTGITALLEAIKLKKKGAPVVEALLRHGADFNICGETQLDGKITPLMLAAMYGLTNVVDMLLKAGAEVDVKDGSAQTALHWAVKGAQLNKHSEDEVIVPLIKASADLNAVSNCGGDNITPVQRAADIGTYLAPIGHDLTKALIEAGSELNRRDMYGKTLLHRAITAGWTDIIDLLLDKGIDLSLCDHSGHTILYDAVYAYGADLKILKRLLDWNCDVQEKFTLLEQCNIRIPGMSLIQVALHSGNLGHLPYLVAAGSPFHGDDIAQYRERVVMVDEVYRWLDDLKSKPHTLKNTSRISVRRALPRGCHMESAVAQLALPGDLQDFVLLNTGV